MTRQNSDNGKKTGRKTIPAKSAKRKFSPNKIKGSRPKLLQLDQVAGAGGRGGRAFDFPNF